MFSISVPVKDQTEYLKTCLKSLEVQSEAYELAVMDATEDDGAQRVIDGYRESIVYSYHRPDDGQAAAIQDGWDNTTGEIVAWLNADDYYFPGALEAVARVFRSDPEADVVYGHGVHVNPDGDFQMYFPAVSENPAMLTKGCVILQPSCFVRRRAMARVGGLNRALHYTMDWDFWIRLYKSGAKFKFVDEPLSLTRVYEETKTISGGGKRFAELNNILKEHGGWPWRLRALAGFRYYDLAHTRSGGMEGAAYLFLKSLRSMKKVFSPSGSIRGVERWSNRVEQECEIALPWYRDSSPQKVEIVLNRGRGVELTCNGRPVDLGRQEACRTIFMGEETEGDKFSGNIEDRGKGLYSFRIRGAKGPFHLLSLKMRPGGRSRTSQDIFRS